MRVSQLSKWPLNLKFSPSIRKYPKRSFCILRNCIRVSDLIQSTKSSVFELQRTTNLNNEDSICSRLRSRKRKHQISQPRQKIKKKRTSKLESKIGDFVLCVIDDVIAKNYRTIFRTPSITITQYRIPDTSYCVWKVSWNSSAAALLVCSVYEISCGNFWQWRHQ